MKLETTTSYENDRTKLTIFLESDENNNYQFIKHIESKDSDSESVVRYSLETFMAEYKLIEKFIQTNLVHDRKFFKQVLTLKTKQL